MNRSLSLALVAGSCFFSVALGQEAGHAQAPPSERGAAQPAQAKPVDLVICLDTSGSMDGLIDAARQRIWEIVNDLATAKPRPALRVALLSYGNDGYSPESGWVRIMTPFTTDLDEVSRQLFELKTNGGTEYVGRVVEKAVTDLQWSSGPGLRLIVVAGNEEADQDKQVTYQKACGDAIAKGIMVNAIYCGNPSDAIAPGWREVAKLADGEYLAIDQNKNEVIPTPHDAKLAELSSRLNTTYIPMGSAGRAGLANQAAQDVNATAAAPAAAAQRAVSKSGGLYHASWDLLDRVSAKDEKERVRLEDVKDEDLPENMRKMTLAERKAYLDEMQKQREQIQKEIASEGEKRAQYLAAEEKKRAAAQGQESFGSAMQRAVREQAKKKGFNWEK